MPGRLEVVRRARPCCSTSRTTRRAPQALRRCRVGAFDFDRLVGVVGVLDDKDAAGILAALEPLLDEVVVTSRRRRARSTRDGWAAWPREVFGPERVVVEPSLPDALDARSRRRDGRRARRRRGAGHRIGHVVGEARTLLRARRDRCSVQD